MSSEIVESFKQHHSVIFEEHGCTPQGVQWSDDQERNDIRYKNIIEILGDEKCSVLDVGCGYGALLDYVDQDKIDYTGMEVVPGMIEAAKDRYQNANFIDGDFLNHDFQGKKFDYVIAHGMFTQKLKASDEEMEAFIKAMIQKMFSLCNKGITFNMMTNRVNYRVDNLYYQNPAEMMDWVLDDVTRHVRLNHAYGLYEFIIRAYA